MTVARKNKSATSTPKKKSAKSTPKKTPTKKSATPKKSPKKAAGSSKSTPKKAAEVPGSESEAGAEAVTPATSATSTPKAKKASAKSTPKKSPKKSPKKAAKAATAKKASPKAASKRKAAASPSPVKKAKTGAVPDEAIEKSIPSDMVVQDHEENEVDLFELSKSFGLVIFAYPAASTPGCTKQVCFFRDSYSIFTENGYKVFGLSNDSPKKNAIFYSSQSLNYPLLSDHSGKLISFLGISQDESHKAVRSAFVIPKGGEHMYCNSPVAPEASRDWAKKIILG